MSFGWSAGDIVAAANLVSRIIKSVGNIGGAREHFQELETELLSLSRALHEIHVLTSEPGQIPEIVALKFVACLCEETLKRFYEKIKPFDATLSIGAESGTRKGKAVPKMVRWELLVKKDIPELRSYLVAHVGSLNVRLNTALLRVASRSLVDGTQNSTMIQTQLQTETRSILEKINSISQGDTIPKLDSLLNVATQVWKLQCELSERFSISLHKLPNPDLHHTWAQAPVRFEDALGRVLPIPSEYDWDTVEAVIQAQFKRGPGHEKVQSREYELYDGTLADIALIKQQNFCPIPGMTIIMAIVLGQYAGSEHCPRLGCKSKSFTRQGTSIEGRTCVQCQSWFRKSKSALPKPLRPSDVGDHNFDLKFKKSSNSSTDLNASRRDRRTYKNLSIYITELPPTPKLIRDKYHQGPEVGPRRLKPQCFAGPRPQANQARYISRCVVPNKSHALELIDEAGDIDEYENTLGEMAAATLDRDFKEGELSAVEQWFRVLSEAERTASVYAFSQQLTPAQIRFFIRVLQQMAWSRPINT